jgi:hypothetical protein
MKKLVMAMTGLTIGALSSHAQKGPVPVVAEAEVVSVDALRSAIKPGPQRMPSSAATVLVYSWENSGTNFLCVFQGNNFLTAGSTWDSKPAVPETSITTGGVTTHFPAIEGRAAYIELSPSETAKRGMAYQRSTTLARGGINHDGLAFKNLFAKDGTDATGTDYSFARPDTIQYHKNILSGKWREFKNGESPVQNIRP